MKNALKIVAALLALLLLVLSWPAWQLYGEIQKARSEDPLVWEEAVSTLELKSRGLYLPRQAVVFIGSSSIRLWGTLVDDMSPIPVIQHGFGGSKLNDIVYYAERLVNAYHPRAVVVFAGTNDIDPAASKSPEVLLASYQAFVRKIRSDQPDLPIFYIGITPSPLRWAVWPIAQSTNQLIKNWSETDSSLHFIDTSDALLGSNGEPNPENYVFDGLHLSKSGYGIWREIIRKRLLDELNDFVATPVSLPAT
jgi:hypothetical protein